MSEQLELNDLVSFLSAFLLWKFFPKIQKREVFTVLILISILFPLSQKFSTKL